MGGKSDEIRKRVKGVPVSKDLESIKDLPPEEIAKLLPDDAKRQLALMVQKSEMFSGPIPPPAMLAEYEKMVPGSAKMWIDSYKDSHELLKKQQEHRHSMERLIVWGRNAREWTGQFMGYTLALSGLGISAWLIYSDNALAGAAIAGLDLVSMVYVFVTGKEKEKK